MAGVKQHYVPQYYLKTFAKNDALYVYDKKRKSYISEERIPTKNIGFSKSFYDIKSSDLSWFLNDKTDDDSFVDGLIEEYNERISAPLIKSFVDLEGSVREHGDIKIMSIIATNDVIDFAVVQLFRTPFFRAQFDAFARQVHEKLKHNNDILAKYTVPRLSSIMHGVYLIAAICNTEIWKNTGKGHLIKPEFQFIDFDVIDKINQLKALSKTLLVTGIDAYFITSDNPIVFKQTKEGVFNHLSFPITKGCSFIFTENNESDKSVIVITEKRKELLDSLNRVMVGRASRFIYSYEKYL